MWNIFKRTSAEEVIIKNQEPESIVYLNVSDPTDIIVYHSSPEDYSPNSIEFVYNGRRYVLQRVYLMKNFCREYRKYRKNVSFKARLKIEDLRIENDHYIGTTEEDIKMFPNYKNLKKTYKFTF